MNIEFADLERNSYDIAQLKKERKENLNKFIEYCENKYKSQIKDVAETLIKGKYKMLLVTGPSSSGKTTTANLISKELVKRGVGSIVVSIDDFFIDLKDTPLLSDGSYDLDNVTTVDIEEFNKFYMDLLKYNKATMPKYNFSKHKRDRWEKVCINPGDMLIVEGLHALNPALIKSNEFKSQTYKLYACTNSFFTEKDKLVLNEQDLRLFRRIHRDTLTRNYSPLKTINQWKHVCEGEKLYVAPFKKEADKIIDTTHAYELFVYAKCLNKLLMPYSADKSIQNIQYILSKFEPLDESVIPQSSLLNEFVPREND